MAITGKLGTADSLLGNIELGGGPLSTAPHIYTPSVTESLTISETCTTVNAKYADISETLTITLTLDTNVYYARDVTEALTLLETAATNVYYSNEISESLTFVEESAPISFRVRDVTESLTLVEDLTTEKTVQLDVSESLTLTETIVRGASYACDISETLTLTETPVGIHVIYADISETLTFLEDLPLEKSAIRNVDETLTFTETVESAGNVFIRDITEPLSLGEDVTGRIPQVFNNSISHTLVFFESVPNTTSFARDVTESLTLVGDTSVRLPMVIDLAISETLTLVEDVPKLSSYTMNVTESFTLTETTVRGARRNNIVSENLFINEQPFTVVAKYRDIEETLTLVEDAAHTKVIYRDVSETLIINQTLASAGNVFGRDISEVLPLMNGRYLPTLVGGQVISIPPVEVVKVPKRCFVLLECAETSTAITLPCPQMGDSEKSLHQQVIKRSMNNKLYTYIRRNALEQLNYQFLIGRPLCLNLQTFCQVNIDRVLTLSNWKGELWKVYITNNPLEYTGKSLFENEGERWEIPFEFQGVKVFG